MWLRQRSKTPTRKVRATGPGRRTGSPGYDYRKRKGASRGEFLSHLLDVNFLIACGWESHTEYARASQWLSRATSFATCPISEMGFLRVSLSPAFGASFEDAMAALSAIVGMNTHRFLRDATPAQSLPRVSTSKDITDAHFVHLARTYKLKLATFDAPLCEKEWARGVAEDPTR